MIQGKTAVRAWFIENAKPYFSIYKLQDRNSGNPFFTNTNKEEQDHTAALHDFEKALSFISTGQFFVIADDNQKVSSKGRMQTEFSISMADAPATTAPAISGTGGGTFDYETMMVKAKEIAKEEFQKMQTEAQLKDAKEKLATAEKEVKALQIQVDKPMNKLLETIAPYAPNIIAGFFPNAGPAIGHIPHTDNHIEENSPEVELTQEQQDAMNATVHNFCEQLAARYPVKENAAPGYKNWLQIMQQLTLTLQNTPDKIDLALKFL